MDFEINLLNVFLVITVFQLYYRPPEGGRLCKWLCVSANLLCLEK